MRKIQWATVILAAATCILLLIDLLIGWEWVKNWSTENTIGTLEAVGTVAVAALAIWGDEIKATFAGPQLKLSLNPDSDVSHAATTRGMCLVRYYHLRVENLRPSVPALNAKVMLVALYKKLGKQHFEKVPLVVPVQLTFPYPTDPAHERTPSIRSAVLCDFGQIIEGN